VRPAHQHQAALLVERISSHASVGKMSTGECSIPGGALSVPQCIGVVHRTRRCRPRLLHLRRLIERVVDECAKFITQIGHCGEKNCGLNKENRLPRQRPLSDRNSTSEQSSMPKRLPILKISRRSVADVLSEILGLQQIAVAGTSFDS